MNYILNKVVYVLERPLLMVMVVVLALGLQVINLTREVKNNQAEIRELRVGKVSVIPIPAKQVLQLPSEVHIPNMPTNTKLPQEK